MPDLLTLAAMKAFALGKRAKWKDYIDLYFILQSHSLGDIVKKTEEIFGNQFNEKLFRQQLSYYKDLRNDEPVVYKQGFKITDEKVKEFLTQVAIS
jgi:hypothetical protein